MKDFKGFSIVEALVALSIFAIIASVFIPIFSTFLQRGSRTELRSMANTIGQTVLETERNAVINPLSAVPTTPQVVTSTDTTSVPGRTFFITLTRCPSGGVCDRYTRQLSVSVRENDSAGQVLSNLETIYTRLNDGY